MTRKIFIMDAQVYLHITRSHFTRLNLFKHLHHIWKSVQADLNYLFFVASTEISPEYLLTTMIAYDDHHLVKRQCVCVCVCGGGFACLTRVTFIFRLICPRDVFRGVCCSRRRPCALTGRGLRANGPRSPGQRQPRLALWCVWWCTVLQLVH